MTAAERAELEQHWDYLFSIPPGEVKHYEWHEAATELREEIARLREALITERAHILARDFWSDTKTTEQFRDEARAALLAEGVL